MPNLTIEPGNLYKLRNGDEGKVLTIILGVAIGYLLDGSIVPCKWELDGRESYGNDHRDIIAPWTDPPVVDWSKLPKHIVAVAQSRFGECMDISLCRNYPISLGVFQEGTAIRYSVCSRKIVR